MDCREFREKHVAFVDDTLPGIDLVAMQRHVLECEPCARHDASVRRALMVLRSLPEIEPSPDFAERLNARLHAVGPVDMSTPPGRNGPALRSFLVAAASVITIGYLTVHLLEWNEPPRPIQLAPVVATRPALPPTPVATPALVASVSAGVPVWSAVLMAEQAPMHFADTQTQLVSWTR